MTRQNAAEALVFHALGDVNRRSMLGRLVQGPITASRLGEAFGLSISATLQHLQILEQARLVQTQKNGRTRVCTLDPAGFKIARTWLDAMRLPAEKQLARLGQILDE